MPPTRRNRMKNHMFSMCFPRMHKIFAMIFAIAVECSLCHNISTDSHSMTICVARAHFNGILKRHKTHDHCLLFEDSADGELLRAHECHLHNFAKLLEWTREC